MAGRRRGMPQSFKAEVMRKEGYTIDPARPDAVKFEVAKQLGVPLEPQNNGSLTTEEAGHIGGRIGGAMVKEAVRMAMEKLASEQNR